MTTASKNCKKYTTAQKLGVNKFCFGKKFILCGSVVGYYYARLVLKEQQCILFDHPLCLLHLDFKMLSNGTDSETEVPLFMRAQHLKIISDD